MEVAEVSATCSSVIIILLISHPFALISSSTVFPPLQVIPLHDTKQAYQ